MGLPFFQINWVGHISSDRNQLEHEQSIAMFTIIFYGFFGIFDSFLISIINTVHSDQNNQLAKYSTTYAFYVQYQLVFYFNKIMRSRRNNPQAQQSVILATQSNSRIKRTHSSITAHQFLRIAVLEKQESIKKIFNMNQKQLCDYFVNYKPLSYSKVNTQRIIEEMSQQVRLIKNKQKIYFGGIKKNQKYGQGILIDNSGKIYEGKFEDDAKTGHGIEIYPNGNIYIGQFSKNKKHGKGQFYWFSMSPQIHKQSLYVQYYDGHWWGGLPDGSGSHQKANGDIYDGQFKNGLKHGKGQQYFCNGDSYKGQYINGMPQGQGIYIWNDGSKYQGDFKQGLRSGKGIWISTDNKDQYKGQYLLDKKSGYGQYSWLNKSYLYKGYFQNDLRHGYGEMYKNGLEQYKGQWDHGIIKQNGKSFKVQNNKTDSFTKNMSESKLPSLSMLKPPSSAILYRIKNQEMSLNSKQFQRVKSPVSMSQDISKMATTTMIGLSPPKRKISQKTIKRRPISSVHTKHFCDSGNRYELLLKKCTKRNCGCNVTIPVEHKVVSKERRRLISQIGGRTKGF